MQLPHFYFLSLILSMHYGKRNFLKWLILNHEEQEEKLNSKIISHRKDAKSAEKIY
jgi:hypothetical protein